METGMRTEERTAMIYEMGIGTGAVLETGEGAGTEVEAHSEAGMRIVTGKLDGVESGKEMCLEVRTETLKQMDMRIWKRDTKGNGNVHRKANGDGNKN